MRYALTEASPPEPPGVSCRYFLVDPEHTDRNTILVVAFDGEYPDGSRGRAHGSYIAAATLHGLHAFHAHCVILDFRGLAYRWGDTLLGVFQDISQFKDAGTDPDEIPFPVVVVTSERCRDGILSLLTGHGQALPEWHFQDLDEAIQYGVTQASNWLNS